MLNTEELLGFIYQTPYGIISADNEGNIDLMNAFASQLLVPLAPTADFNQLFSVLDTISPCVVPLIKNFSETSGCLCENYRVAVKPTNQPGSPCWLDYTIFKLNANHWMIGFLDSSRLVLQEQQAQEEAAKQAENLARLEMATSVIHDIGNAITAVGISAAKLVAKDSWSEINNLQRTVSLLNKNISGLNACLGEGKGQALTTFINSICDALTLRQDELISSSQGIAQNVHHIQGIISIQKQFARDGKGVKQLPISVCNLIHDAKAVVCSLLTKANAQCIIVEIPPKLTVVGDKTRLTQVMVNTLKNACEAILARDEASKGEIRVFTNPISDGQIQIDIKDNGIGFDQATAKKINNGGYTSKTQGSGIGLSSSRSVIESHGGELRLHSEGINKGCRLSITLPTSIEA